MFAIYGKISNCDWILEHHEVYVYPRIKTDGGELKEHPKVHITEAPVMQIVSTDIRKAIKNGKNVSFMLPEKVWKYIDEELLYR